MRSTRARVIMLVTTVACAAVMGTGRPAEAAARTAPPGQADTHVRAEAPGPAETSPPDDAPAAFEAAVLDPPATAEARADAPVMTLDPATGVEPDQAVQVTVTGLTGGPPLGIFQCDAALLDDLQGSDVFESCPVLHIELGGVGDPYVRDVLLREVLTYTDEAGTPVLHCGRAPGNCAVVVWNPNTDEVAGVTFDMEPSPLAMVRSAQEAGYPVGALVTVPPGSAVQAAQCVEPVGATMAASTCSPAQPVTPDAQGYADLSFDLLGEVPGPSGPAPCSNTACALALFDGDGTTLDSATVRVLAQDGPPRVTLGRSYELTDNWLVEAEVTGMRNESIVIAQCHSSVAATGDIAGGPCGPSQHHEGSPVTTGVFPELRLHTTFEGADGATYHCDQVPGDCVVAIASNEGNVDAAPIGFTRPDEVTLSPASGLLAGDEIAVDASGLAPGANYHVLLCAGAEPGDRGDSFDAGPCETPVAATPAVVASPTGTLATTAVARDRFTTIDGSPVYCRAQCQVAVVHADYWTGGSSVATYGLAAGELAATPSDGLADGQEVTVTGTDLMPSYDGPMWWFLTTGTWALGQCGADVLDDPTVAAVFRYCSVPPGGGALDVPGSTFDRSIEVAVGLDPPAGDPVDCAMASNACVVALTRVEQDGTVSLHTTPLAFAPLRPAP